MNRITSSSSSSNDAASTATAGSLFTPNSSALVSAAFAVDEKPVAVVAFNLPIGVSITFEQIINGVATGMTMEGCCTIAAKDGQVMGVRPYTHCKCTPTLSSTSTRLIIPERGIYRAVLSGPIGSGRVVFYDDEITVVDDVSRGCCPPEANLKVTKTVSDPTPAAGDTGFYTVVVTNNGPSNAGGTIVREILPVGLNYTSVVATYANGAVGATPTVAELRSGYVIPVLPVGAMATYLVNYTVPAGSVGQVIRNHVIVVPPKGVIDPDLTDNEDQVFLTVVAKTLTVDVSVTKAADKSTYAIGDTVTYTINFSNAGPSDANGTIIKDVLPASLTSVSITTTFAGGAGVGVPSQAQLAAGWVVSALPAGGSGVITITGITTVAGVLTNQVSITAPPDRTDTNTINNNSIVVISVNANPLTKCNGQPLDPVVDRVLVKGDLQKCVNGALVPLACGDIVKTITCPEQPMPVPPLDIALCSSPSFILGESASGDIRKYPRTLNKIITPLDGSLGASSTTTPIGAYGPSQTLLVTNPSQCFSAVALITYTNTFQIDNRDNVIRAIVEIDVGNGVYKIQVNSQLSYLKNAPIGMSQVDTYESDRTIFSIVIPAGGSITIGSRMRTEVQVLGTVPAVFEAAFAFINAIVFVDQVI